MKKWFKIFLSVAVFLQMPVAWSAVKSPQFGYNKNYQKIYMSNRDLYERSQKGKIPSRSGQRPLKNNHVRQVIINGKPLTNDSPLWYQGGAKPVTDRPFTSRNMKLDSIKLPGTSKHLNVAFKDVVGPDGKIYRRYAESGPDGRGRWRDVELPQGPKPSELRQEIQSYRKAGGMIAKRFVLDTLGFYFAGNAVQGTLHRLGGANLDEKFEDKVDEMVKYVEANPDDTTAQMLGHTFASEIFQNYVLLGDPLALEYLNKIKPVLDPRFIQSEFEMSFTEPKGAAHFASFIGINTLYGIWINNQYVKASSYIKANNPRFMSQRTLNSMFKVFRNNYFSMMVASVGASVVTDTAFMAYDCTITKIMDLDPNNLEDRIKLEKCDDAYFEYKTGKIYERWLTTASYQLIPAAYFSANLQRGITFAYNVGQDIFARPKPMMPPGKLNMTGQFRRLVRGTRAQVAGVAEKAAASANTLLNAVDNKVIEKTSQISNPGIQRIAVNGFYTVKGVASPVASMVRIPFSTAAVIGKGVDAAVNGLKGLARAHPAMTFALITVPHFYNFLFWNEIFMPAYEMGMSESHSEFVDSQEDQLIEQMEQARAHGFDARSMIMDRRNRSRSSAGPSFAQYNGALKESLYRYGKFQTQYRNFLLEEGNMGLSNWKMHLMSLDQRLVGAETVYRDFLQKLAEKEKYPEIFNKSNDSLEFFSQVKPLEANANPDDSGRFQLVYKVKDLEGMSEQEINKARMDTVMIARQLLVDTKTQLLPLVAKRTESLWGRARAGMADLMASVGIESYEVLDSADPALVEFINKVDEYLALFKDYNPQRDQVDMTDAQALNRYWLRLHKEWDRGIQKLAQAVRADQGMNDLCQQQALGGLYCLFQYTYERLGAPTFRGQDYFDSLALHMYSTRLASDETSEKTVGNLRTRHYGEYMLGQMACGPDPFADSGNMAFYNTQTALVKKMKDDLAQCKTLITDQVAVCNSGDYEKAGQAVCDRYAAARAESPLLPPDLRPFRRACTSNNLEEAGQRRCESLTTARIDDDRFGGTYFENWLKSPNTYMQSAAKWSYEFFGDFPECSDYVVSKSSFLKSITGFAFGFDPPRLLDQAGICNQGYGMANVDVAKESTGNNALSNNKYNRLMNPFAGEWMVGDKSYRNFVDLVAENLGGHVFRAGNNEFDIFWNNHVKPYSDQLFRHAHDQYLDLVEYSIKPALYGRLHYRTGQLFPPLEDLREIVDVGGLTGWAYRHIRMDEIGAISSLRLELDFYFNEILPELLIGAISVERIQKRRAFEKLRVEKVDDFINEFAKSFEDEGLEITEEGLKIFKAFLTDDPAFEEMEKDLAPEFKMILIGMQVGYPEYIQQELDKFDLSTIVVSDLDMEKQRQQVRDYLSEMQGRFEEKMEMAAKFESKSDKAAFKQNSYELLMLLQRLMIDLGQSELSAQLGEQCSKILNIEKDLPEEQVEALKEEVEALTTEAVEGSPSEQVAAAAAEVEEAPLEGQDKWLEAIRSAEDSEDKVTEVSPNSFKFDSELPEIWVNEMQHEALKQSLQNALNGLTEFSGHINLIEDLNYSERLGIQ